VHNLNRSIPVESLNRPKVFVIAGVPASGKTNYARSLQKIEQLTILDLDDFLEQLIEENAEHVYEIGIEAFIAEIREYRYNNLRERGVALVDEGKSVALVAPFTQHIHEVEHWNWLCEPFVARGITPVLHWLYVNPEEQMKRIKARAAKRDSEKISSPENYKKFLASKDPTPPVVPYFEVSN